MESITCIIADFRVEMGTAIPSIINLLEHPNPAVQSSAVTLLYKLAFYGELCMINVVNELTQMNRRDSQGRWIFSTVVY